MSYKEEQKSISWVIFSGIVGLFLSALLSLLMPKYMAVDEYALYRTYAMYYSYVGIFHFGFINGIYLRYGNLKYSELPFNTFRMYTRFLFLLEGVVQGILLVIVWTFGKSNQYVISMIFAIINIIFANFISYFSLINQFTKRFVFDSKVQICYSAANAIFISFLLLTERGTNWNVLIIVTFINVVATGMYMIKNADLIIGSRAKIQNSLMDIFENFKRGIYINIGELVGILILGIDSLFVNIFFSYSNYAVYSFSIVVITFFFQLVSIIAKLIFPYLVRTDRRKYLTYYWDMKRVTFACITTCMIFMFFVDIGFQYLLPSYIESTKIIKILCVSVVFKAMINIVCNSFYKAMNLERTFFLTNIVALLMGIVTNCIAWKIFASLEAIAIASTITFITWYLLCDMYLMKQLGEKRYMWWNCAVIGQMLIFVIVLLSRNSTYFILYVLLSFFSVTKNIHDSNFFHAIIYHIHDV